MTAAWSELEARLEATGWPCWIKDPTGRYLAVTEAFAAYVGAPATAMRGRSDAAFWPAPDVGQFRADDLRALASGRAAVVPEHSAEDGFIVTIKVPFRSRDGAPAGTLGVFFRESPGAGLARRIEARYGELLRGLGELPERLGLSGHGRGLESGFETRPVLGSERVPAWLEQVRRRLTASYRRPPTVRVLAREAGVHASHLGRAFRRAFGVRIHEYVRQLRVNQACVELLVSDRPAGEIALELGFADQSHFIRAFRRATGRPPSDYRRSGGSW